MDLISVIVPVFKVEAYLDKCVQSIVNQTYQNLEIILVDDGSPDRCGEMCDAWAEKDSRIRVIHTPNQGSSAARNTALDAARGELIAFVDSDDYLEPGMLTHLYGLLGEDVDIAECGFLNVYDDNAEFDLSDSTVRLFLIRDAMKEHIQDRIFRQVIWNKLYRRHTLEDVRFPVGKKIDDEFFTYRAIGNARKLACSEWKCYAYRQQPDSIMHTIPVLSLFLGVEAKVQRHAYILERFPDLAGFSLKCIIESCLYLNQLAMHTTDFQTVETIRSKTNAILKKYPPDRSTFAVMTLKERIWLGMAVMNMPLTCRIRNTLGIGL